jgi:FtsH-binding integral membrane protein
MAELDQQSLIETRLIEAKAYADGMQADAAIAREQARTSASMIKRAQWMSFILLLTLIGGAIYSVSKGQQYAAIVLALTGIGGAVAVLFGVSRRARRQDTEQSEGDADEPPPES